MPAEGPQNCDELSVATIPFAIALETCPSTGVSF